MMTLNKLKAMLSDDVKDKSLVASAIAAMIQENFSYDEIIQHFDTWEKHGFHLIPTHFYQPIPDTSTLSDSLWNHPRSLPGVDLNAERQVDFLRTIFPKFKDEYLQLPRGQAAGTTQFYLGNNSYDGYDALVLYCMIRYFRPKRIIECGSGYSTLLTAKAALLNGDTEFQAIEPFPNKFLKQGIPGLSTLYEKKIEDIDIALFQQLELNDILFIDTSHVVNIGGDVNTIYLEIIPQLNNGVIVHIHDIFFPFEYPKEWVLGLRRYWTEQYLLQAFLAFNSNYEVLFCNSYMQHYYGREMKTLFPNSPCGGSSFWMRKK